MESDIIKLLSTIENEKVTFNSIKKKIKCSKNDLEKILNKMELDGVIYKDDDSYYQIFPNDFLIGTIHMSKNGTYSVNIDNHQYTIKKTYLNSALNDDLVVVKKEKNGNYNVVKILKRKTNRIVCEVVEKNGIKQIKPCFIYQNFNVKIDLNDLKKRVDGERILVELSTEEFNKTYTGKYINTVGYKNDPNLDLNSIAAANNFRIKFSEEVEKEKEHLQVELKKEDLKGRLDLRKSSSFTIDGVHSKDFDDALSYRLLPNGNAEVSVHIAQVSNFVKFGSEMFNEALERGNSLYMLDTVIPMLPQILSNGICSLNEGVDRLTRSVIMEIDKDGNVVDYRIVKSIINSKKRMNYDDVNQILENNNVPEGYENFVNDLKSLNELSNILSEKNKRNGSIEFASDETEVIYNQNGKIDSIEIRSQHSAEKLIENFMVLANNIVAEDFFWKKVPFIFRNHGVPDNEKIYDTIHLLKKIGYRIGNIKSIDNPKVIQRILTSLSSKEEFPILSSLLLKAMQKASYQTENIGHYGLGLEYYTHFTSPIRRISDLTIHNLIDLYEEGKIYKKEDLIQMEEFLKNVCQIASEQERNADIAEYQAYKLASIKYLEDQIGNDFEARITDIGPNYIKIRTDNNVDGVIELNMCSVKHKYKLENKAMLLTDYNATYFIGNKINVTLKETSVSDLELYFNFSFIKEKVKKRTIT